MLISCLDLQHSDALCKMGYMTTHKNWWNRISKGDTERAASQKSGVTTSTLNRQLSKGRLSAEVVIAIARGYRESPVEALAATGYLTPDEVTGIAADAAAQLLTDQQLIRELARRIDSNESAWAGTFDGVLAASQTDAEVVAFPDPDTWQPGEYVADSSPEEPEPGDEGPNSKA